MPIEPAKTYPKTAIKTIPIKEIEIAAIPEVKTPTNSIPTSSDKTVKIKEDTRYVFKVSDFSFSDKDSSDILVNIKITKLQRVL